MFGLIQEKKRRGGRRGIETRIGFELIGHSRRWQTLFRASLSERVVDRLLPESLVIDSISSHQLCALVVGPHGPSFDMFDVFLSREVPTFLATAQE